MISPASKVKLRDKNDTNSFTGKIIMPVLLSCTGMPFKRVVNRRFWISATSSFNRTSGPKGKNVSNDLPLNHPDLSAF